MITDILLSSLALLVLLIATYNDFKTKEIPDWLNFSFLATASVVRFLHALIFTDWAYFLAGVVGFGAMFLVAMMLYYGRQWGGGDAKLLMGLGVAFATTPSFASATSFFLVDILINIFAVGALYGLLQAVVLFVKHFSRGVREMRRSLRQARNIQLLSLGLAALIFGLHYVMPSFFRVYFVGVAVFLLLYTYAYLFVKAVEKVCMFKMKKVDQVTEGDWIAKAVVVNRKVVLPVTPLGISKKQILKLKEHRVKEVLVKEGIAFVPAIFLGVLATLFWGNLLLYLL